MSANVVRIIFRAEDDTDRGMARVRRAADQMSRHFRDRFRQSGDESGRSFLGRFGATLNQGFTRAMGPLMRVFGQMGENASGAFAGTFGTGVQALSSNPYILAGAIAVGTTIAVAMAGVIASILGGAIVLGLGGAVAGIGLLIASKAENVKKSWGSTLKSLKKDFADAAKPMEPVLIRLSERVRDLGHKFAPRFKASMEQLAPVVDGVFGKIFKALDSPEAKRAFDSLISSFTHLVEDLDIDEWITDVFDSFDRLFKTVDEHHEGIATIFNGLMEVLPLLIDFINGTIVIFFELLDVAKKVGRGIGKAWDWVKEKLGPVIEWLAEKIKTIPKSRTFKLISKGISTVIGWVQKVIGWIKRIRSSKTFKMLQKGFGTVIGWAKKLIGWINRIRSSKTFKMIQRGISGVIGWIKKVIGWINNIPSFKSITLSIATPGLAAAKWLASKFASGGVVGYASGGVVGRAASGGPRSNTVLVGEQGPELVNLAPGSSVIPNGKTMQMLGQGGSPQVTVVLEAGDSDAARLLVSLLRPHIKNQHGGNVQLALGGRR